MIKFCMYNIKLDVASILYFLNSSMNSNGVMEAKGRQYTHNVTLRLNHCSSGKTVNITYHACAFVALGNQHAMRMFHIVICDLSGSKIFFHIIS